MGHSLLRAVANPYADARIGWASSQCLSVMQGSAHIVVSSNVVKIETLALVIRCVDSRFFTFVSTDTATDLCECRFPANFVCFLPDPFSRASSVADMEHVDMKESVTYTTFAPSLLCKRMLLVCAEMFALLCSPKFAFFIFLCKKYKIRFQIPLFLFGLARTTVQFSASCWTQVTAKSSASSQVIISICARFWTLQSTLFYSVRCVCQVLIWTIIDCLPSLADQPAWLTLDLPVALHDFWTFLSLCMITFGQGSARPVITLDLPVALHD